jgi:Tetratricopeptide repeat
MAKAERVLDPTYPDTHTIISNLATLYRKQGHYKEAELLLGRALEARESVLGKKHPEAVASRPWGILVRHSCSLNALWRRTNGY